ncbi:MAG: cyclic nucleotide-binding domain-containing protein [Acidobacteriota bacterium]
MKAVFRTGPGTPRSPFERYLVTHPMGDIIFSEGEIGTEMYIIQSGTVELLKEIGGETRVLSTLEKGDFFGEMSVLEDLPRTASARAKTDVDLVRINGATFDAMLKSNTEIAVRMLRKLSRRIREITDMLEQEIGHAVPEVQKPAATRTLLEPSAFRLVGDGAKTFFLHSEGDTLIGRGDPVTGINPDVDLAPIDPQRSMSRRHAKIYPMAGKLYLMEEIGVMNGTFVNGSRVTTGTPVPVSSGDQLRFGLVTLKLETAGA